MKTIATVVSAIALSFAAASKAEARDHCEDRYPSSIYISGRASCGTPVYTERFLVRIDRHGCPVWGYRTLPVSYHSGRGGHDRGRDYCEPSRGDRYRDDDRGYDRGYDRRGPSVHELHREHREAVRRTIGAIFR